MRDRIESILNQVVAAPSGDNSQPWTFLFLNSNTIEVYNIPGKDNPILNYNQTGSYVSHGAVLRSIRLLAPSVGLSAEVSYFPGAENCTARIAFTETSIPLHSLANSIKDRHSNRKHYKRIPISESDSTFITTSAAEVTGAQFRLSKPDVDKKKLASALSSMEDIALQVPELHELFFKDILWDRELNDKGVPGLYIKTLELPPPAQLAMRVLKNWNVTDTLNRTVGLSKKIAGEMASVYKDSASYGAIFIPNRSSASYLTVGEMMQMAWLAATSRGISVQPVTGLMFLAHRAEEKDLTPIPDSFTPQILSSYRTAVSAFDAPPEHHLAFLMRFGHSSKATARSRRLPPVIVS